VVIRKKKRRDSGSAIAACPKEGKEEGGARYQAQKEVNGSIRLRLKYTPRNIRNGPDIRFFARDREEPLALWIEKKNLSPPSG